MSHAARPEVKKTAAKPGLCFFYSFSTPVVLRSNQGRRPLPLSLPTPAPHRSNDSTTNSRTNGAAGMGSAEANVSRVQAAGCSPVGLEAGHGGLGSVAWAPQQVAGDGLSVVRGGSSGAKSLTIHMLRSYTDNERHRYSSPAAGQEQPPGDQAHPHWGRRGLPSPVHTAGQEPHPVSGNRTCPAGHVYWWPSAKWQHERCFSAEVSRVASVG